MIDEKIIDDILSRADIVDVVSEFVDLKHKGINYQSCCPFHEEKTPSFFVNRERGTWHCFGSCDTGGNVISFIQKIKGFTFPDAVKWLAKKYNIDINEDNHYTQQQQDEYRKKEAMYIINQYAQAYYVDNIHKKNDSARAALSYANKRWGVEFTKEFGLGYSTADWQGFYNFAKDKGLSDELMLELGIIRKSEKGRIYDFFRDRLMIPIRDKYHRVIGFTARTMNDLEEHERKYMNSSTSIMYDKSKSLFGLDTAMKSIAAQEKVYVVEGAPDVMKLQSVGINNVVASLGTAWSDWQFEQLNKIHATLCFLPDADPLQADGKPGTGIKKVLQNGEHAMRCGCSVSVREIEVGPDNKKQDPDSFVTNKYSLNALEEIDFVVWYAQKTFDKDDTVENRNSQIKSICKLLCYVKDKSREQGYISELSRQFKNKNLWINVLNEEKKKKSEAEISNSNKIDIDILHKYGFTMSPQHYYYAMQDDGGTVEWSNFILEPLFHIRDSISAKRIFKITNRKNESELIEIKQEDLISLAKFKQKVESIGNFVWLRSDAELTKLKLYLYEKTETAFEITQMGWNRKGFYAWGNGAFENGQFVPVDEKGIVRLKAGNYYLPAQSMMYKEDDKLFQFERKFVHNNYSAVKFSDVAQKMYDVFGDNAKIGIAFLIATLFKDIVTSVTKSFPILNLFGPKGSGKSELGHTLMSFFITNNVPPNIQNSTIASLSDAVAQCSNALVHIDEFKNNIDIDKREFLKGLWDGAGRSRMNMDRDKKREQTRVDSAVIMSGQEMATADIALFSRLIYLTFDKSEHTQLQKNKFRELSEMRNLGFTHITLSILSHRAMFESRFPSMLSEVQNDINNELRELNIEDRIMGNWIIPLAAYKCLQDVIDVPFTYADMRDITISGIKIQAKECTSNNELANFWNSVSYMLQDGQIFNNCDFRIKCVTKLNTDKIKDAVYANPKIILQMNKNHIFMKYRTVGRLIGDNVLPAGSLLYYLENSKAYMGVQHSVRFDVVIKGEPKINIQSFPDGSVKRQKETRVDNPLIFDYEMIKNIYNINLETYNSENDILIGENKNKSEKKEDDLPF
jgi:DNA primase